METSSARKARRREWWRKKKSELRKKRDKTGAGKSAHQTVRSKGDRTISGHHKTPQVEPKRGFRSTVGIDKMEQSSHVKQKPSKSDQPAFSEAPALSPASLSRSVKVETTSDSESESSIESVKSDSEAESVKTSQDFTAKQTQNTKSKHLERQKPESITTTTGTTFTKRYILFLGNLPRSASQDDVIEHFSKKGVPITELRLLTDKESGKSKGCAFAEFSSNKAMQNALKFHRSKLRGRTINVEVTCGGGGKGSERLKKIRERNRTLRRTMTVKSGKVMKSKART